jgi:hypothetical protein
MLPSSEPVGFALGGTFEQLEDSRTRGLRGRSRLSITRCLPFAAATARLLADDRERTHRGHDSGLFPRRPPHPQERPGHAGHDSIAGSLADFPQRDLYAITNDCHERNGATPRRVWPARSHTSCLQKLLRSFNVQRSRGATHDPLPLRPVIAEFVALAVM